MHRLAVKQLQRDLNYFTETFLKGLAPLMVDGKPGPATNHRIRIVKWNLGEQRPLDVSIPRHFNARLRNPKSRKYASAAAIARGAYRRRNQRKHWAKNLQAAARRHGVGTYDGKPVALWLIPYLQFARSSGIWHGQLNSGWRDPAYSEHLCFVMCGAATCRGRCAGRSSHHSQSSPPNGAIDVSDYVNFAKAMRVCPLSPHIFNSLGAIDPVHFSAQGN